MKIHKFDIFTLQKILLIATLALFTLNLRAEVSQDSVIAGPLPTKQSNTKCQRWVLNTVKISNVVKPYLIPDPKNWRNYGGAGSVDIGTCLFSLPVIGCIIPVIPWPWVGAPFYSDGWDFRCPSDRPYLKSFDETWAANFNAGGRAWTDNFYCTAAPNQIPQTYSQNVWVQNTTCDGEW